MPTILAIESSCDETAVAILRERELLANVISSSAEAQVKFGGVVPEVASRAHIQVVDRLCKQALNEAGLSLSKIDAPLNALEQVDASLNALEQVDASLNALEQVDAFAATAGPGLASSLLIGNSFAKALALGSGKPFISVNHMEGHLLSPFIEHDASTGIPPHLALIVSGGHTMLLHVKGVGQYQLLGKTRDDAAGEAFDKIGKMLGLPYPAGPHIDQLARKGDGQAYDFPRSMLKGPRGVLKDNFEFSFSGLKTSMRYLLPEVDVKDPKTLANLCASVQAAIVEVLVEKAMAAAKYSGLDHVGLSGGVACNTGLRETLQKRCNQEGFQLHLVPNKYSTDNAAMIAFAAMCKFEAGETTALEEDVNPNLNLAK